MFGRNNIKMKRKKGVFFSMDVLIAVSIIFVSILVVYPVLKHPYHESFVQSDLMVVLSTLKIGEINNSYVNNNLISNGKINDLNKSIIEQLGEFYVSNITLAKELANEILFSFNTSENIGIWYDDDMLASKNKTSFENAKNSNAERQIISGIEKGKSTEGFVSKAWLKKINSKKNTLFIKGDLMCGGWKLTYYGYYCSTTPVNATYKFNIPANTTIISGTWLAEPSWTPQYTKLYLNGNKIFQGNINYYRIQNITSYLIAGNNTAVLEGSIGGEDGASHFVIDYESTDMATYQQQKIFPFNKVATKSVLHYEKSLFVPTQISIMNLSINASMNTTLNFRIGNQTIFIGSKNPVNNRVEFSNSEIQSALTSQGISYSNLNNEYFFFILDIGKNNPNVNTILGENSYVSIDSSQTAIPYGSIDITGGIPIKSYSNLVAYTFYRNLTWEFFLPKNSIPLYADWQFGWFLTGTTTQKAIANSNVLFNSPPYPFINAFARFSYTPSRASGLFREGGNNFSLEFGNGYSVSNEASYGFLTFFIKNYVNYGNVKEKAQGGKRTIQFEDGSSKQIIVGNQNDIWDPDNDALDDAVERLISQMDSNGNGKVDVTLDQESFDIDTLDISKVPYMWRTEVQIRRWD